MTEEEVGTDTSKRIGRVVYVAAMIAAFVLWVAGILGPSEFDDRSVASGSVVLNDGTPATIFVPGGTSSGGPGGVSGPPGKTYPLVVIAHGFVGDRVGLMYLAEWLARNGYAVVTYDAPGHGQNTKAFGSSVALTHLEAMSRVIEWAVTNRSVDSSRIAVAGHSMGAATALEFASSDLRPAAVLAISGGWAATGPHRPKNVMFIYTSGDPAYLKDRVAGVTRELAGERDLAEGKIYGDISAGDAVTRVEVRGADHLSIVTSAETVQWLVAWLRDVFRIEQESSASTQYSLVPAEDSETAPTSIRQRYSLLFGLAAILAYGCWPPHRPAPAGHRLDLTR